MVMGRGMRVRRQSTAPMELLRFGQPSLALQVYG